MDSALSNNTGGCQTGGCQCGAIAYRFHGALTDCCYCHCSVCRKLTGAEMGVYGTVAQASFEWLRGEGLVSVYQQTDSTNRMFCSQCGSNLISTHALTPSQVYVSLGSLDDTAGIKIKYQQFTASKAAWTKLDSQILSFVEWPDWVAKHINKPHSN